MPDAELHLLDAGHFALETHREEIASLTDAFLHHGRSDQAMPAQRRRQAST